MPRRILIIATDGFEQSELTGPRSRLEQAGHTTIIASPESGKIKGWNKDDWGDEVKVGMKLEDAEAKDFDALLLPGGQMNPDRLRLERKVPQIIRDFLDQGKPVAAICHAPWLLAEAGVIAGKTVTAWPSIRKDLANAGANVIDNKVVVDGKIITSRMPDDIPAFSDALLRALEDQLELPEPA
ncbi:type 1 glutamine amidotransferase domain-containing protein [Alteraurantiacibacter aquimixticola]|uniref:Type 1 glutamine amidotransferase n=1 Tax=Alteraurantiacibacter aquimixticola TaxID=2489173 RepID=A0A4T3F3H0_9SPHN|nr:type 1 glutamine amidotransferase domain-containing protein [Alteraurantiacibacter aquimixticola]TIX51806.1 type 1 glutamine amidotransferase [Alteraurantiacibacter aquimixticola]